MFARYTFPTTDHFILDSVEVGDNISKVGDNYGRFKIQPLIGYGTYDLMRTGQAPHLHQVGFEDKDKRYHAALCLMMEGNFGWETVEEALTATGKLISSGHVYFNSHTELYATDSYLDRQNWNKAAQQFCENMGEDLLMCLLESTVGETYSPDEAVDQLFTFTEDGAYGLVWDSLNRQLVGFDEDGTIVWVRQAREDA